MVLTFMAIIGLVCAMTIRTEITPTLFLKNLYLICLFKLQYCKICHDSLSYMNAGRLCVDEKSYF